MSATSMALPWCTLSVQLLVALGGGSAIDTAKAASIVLACGGCVEDYEGENKSSKPGLPIAAVNTTAGTGSECTSFYIVTDPVRHSKMAMVDPADFGTLADLALRDTCMTTNQITPTRQEVIAVYTAAFRG